MRILLDTSAVNWLADHQSFAAEFFAARNNGRIQVLVPPEVATEIRNTVNLQRRTLLEDLLARFFPLTPTRVPRLGAFRLNMARLPTDGDLARLEMLQHLKDGADRSIAANAGGYRCDVFVTRDREMSRTKRLFLEHALSGTRVLEPEALLEELRGGTL